MMTLDNRHKFTLPYWARPGVSLFAKKTDDEGEGGADSDDDSDDDDEDDEEEDDDLADLSEDELRAELKKTRESLSKASGSSKKKRDTIKNLRAEIAKRPATTSKKKTDDDDEVDVEAVKTAAKAEARAESDARIRKTAARAELKAAGIPAEQVNRLVGMLDLDSLDVDDEGEVDGLDEAIDELKADWPQLFAKRPAKRKRESASGGAESASGDGKRKLTPSQIQAARVTGKRAS